MPFETTTRHAVRSGGTPDLAWSVPVMRVGFAGRGLVYLAVASISLYAIWRGGRAHGTSPVLKQLEHSVIGDTVLALEEAAVVSEIRNDANRLANADHANLVRTSRAARAQIDAVRRLELDALPDDLRELAELRLRLPTASTAELARRAGLTKASAYRRLRRLVELAEQ